MIWDQTANFQRIRQEWRTTVACWVAYSEGKADLALSILEEAESMKRQSCERSSREMG